ncbi:MAG: DUF4299 domain-containing protein [Oscillospiraceae bacterium]|nr:DUF4299 domain-containing protein [Oscillospiraceae bacterium]
MGLFGKKKHTNDELNAIWEDAYRANPHVYENRETGKIIVGLALTETTDSLFPLAAEKQWAIEGREIDIFIISMVSITKEAVLGQIEYGEAMKRLEPYFLAEKDGWVLIRGLSLDEMEALFEGLPRNIV